MAGPKVGKIEFKGDNASARRAIQGVSTELGNAEKSIKGFSGGMVGSLKTITSGFLNWQTVAVAAVIAVGAAIKKQIDTMEDLEKMAQRTGVSVENLSTLRFAAELASTEIEVFEKGLQRLSRNLLDTSKGMGTAKESFETLGIPVQNVNGGLRDTYEVLLDVADRFSKMPDGAEKTARAMEIFGRAGADLIPMLNGGAEGLKNMQDEARALGLEISTETAKDAAYLKDEMTRAQGALEGVAISLTEHLLPALINLVEIGADVINFFNDMLDAATPVSAIVEQLKKEHKDLGEYMMKAHGDTLALLQAQAEEQRLLEQEQRKLAGEEQKRFAKLNEQWEKVALTIQRDIDKAGLTPMWQKIYDIEAKAEDLKKQFGEIPGAIALINEQLEIQRQKILDTLEISKIEAKPGEVPSVIPEGGFQLEELKEAQHAREMERIAEVSEFEMATYLLRTEVGQQTFANLADAANTFYQLSGEKSKAAFALYKAFSIAEAGVATYLAANKALASAPPPFNFILAASVIAAGIANIARIASMQPGSRASGGGASPPSLPSGPASSQTSNDNRQMTVNVTFYGEFDTANKDRVARDLIPYLNKAWGDGA